MTEGNGKILSLTDKRSLGRENDYITRKQAAELVAAEATKVHEYYLNQIPPFVARMIQDALISYGLVQVAPGTTDIAPAPPSETPPPLDAEVIAAPVPPLLHEGTTSIPCTDAPPVPQSER